ncbi:hypothetical protein BBF96_01235 [Anoxybacter fermentans]|uniref:DUF340 domain-containing protein n=1 Tax=Anoxybacter fermentans TaxID=1323375 RepID=A0A3S9SV04_9FIRM|nr:LysO family transporter [Anoxybacter fermentans]AZR72136.1 hypothetical protein BBF96_01235 [Anoxybacter fermentans]
MWTILITLIAGFIIGYLDLIPSKLQTYTQWLTTGGLIILLISMGAGISSNPELISKIKKLGMQSFLLASFSILGSILLVWILEKWLFSKKKGADRKWHG